MGSNATNLSNEKYIEELLAKEEKLAAICLRLQQHRDLSHEEARLLTKKVALKHSEYEKKNAYFQIGLALVATIILIIWGTQARVGTKFFGYAIGTGFFALFRLYKLNKRINYLKSVN